MSINTKSTNTKSASPARGLAARVKASADALAAAEAKETNLRDALAAAKRERASLDRRLSRGDDAVTTADLLAADAELTRCAALLDAARRETLTARRLLVNADDTLAVAVAPVLLDLLALPVSVEVLTETPTTPPAKVPSLRVIQTKPTQRDTISGTIGGNVEVLFYRDALTVSVDGDRLATVLDDAGIRCAVHPGVSDERDGIHVDTFAVEVTSAHEPVPVIEGSVQAWRVNTFGQHLTSAAVEHFQLSAHLASRIGVQTGKGGNASHYRRTVQVKAQEVKVTGSRTTSDGERRVTITATLTAWPTPEYPGDLNDLTRGLDRFVQSQAGDFAGGIGRVKTAEVDSIQPTGTTHGRSVQATFVLVSTTPGTD